MRVWHLCETWLKMNHKANEHRQQATALNKLTGKEYPGRRALEQQGLGWGAVSAVLSHGQNFEANSAGYEFTSEGTKIINTEISG